MTSTVALTNLGNIANAMFNSITANSTAVMSMSVGGHTINATSFAGTANNANNLGGVAAASYQLNSTLAANVATIAANSATFANSSSTNTFTVGTAAYFVANGNVGIGTSSPGARLNVAYAQSGSTNDAIIINNTNGGVNDAGGISFQREGDVRAAVRSEYFDGLKFFTKSGTGSLSERMRVTAGGSLCIGTTTAIEALTVAGGANFTGGVNLAGTLTAGFVRAVTTGVGDVGLSPGSNTNPGYIEFRTAEGTRRGYIGWNGGNVLQIQSENSWNYSFNQAPLVGSNVVLHAGNFNTYSPTLTGNGASGNWGINITGNAATVTNGVYTTGDQSIGGIKTFTTDVRSPIFYDSNDTAWYCNPNSTSRLVNLQLSTGTWHTSIEGWARLYYVWGDSSIYRGGTSGQWSHQFRTQDDAVRWLMEGAGNFWASGNITAYWSDRRLKKNIEKINDWRDIINGLNGYRYEWNDIGCKILENSEPGVQVGLIAQEVQKVVPQAAAVQMMQYKGKRADGTYVPKDDINYDPENPYLTVREEKLIPVLVEAIKGLLNEVDTLKTKYEEMEKRING